MVKENEGNNTQFLCE